ncbi:hypothetical protein FJV41_31255 [Myxococcus llanfairpwllgwyngyllgogerychwyrndrobwllllantysiliogogogochensis]|uniref:Uncharacterized protein n=1 Tax=Myxococcus llanfairpwllgwyngyllgogerychwyrndrobwllllantysiliogogogochensis TaxID=2590453 RepID=A0A540WSJ9_9BACT|nr:hypothetical protein [Myxococcus llanfairpwllgwyngyllgogerychwyrndrobwllllantysiliogogogochensis]TQF12006.1 hypothetical protein FJV41_31255 [Myxococcus llanfairpwllgwyngyllgogerychwyrndrobwllllantysiliogogogochensis]
MSSSTINRAALAVAATVIRSLVERGDGHMYLDLADRELQPAGVGDVDRDELDAALSAIADQLLAGATALVTTERGGGPSFKRATK